MVAVISWFLIVTLIGGLTWPLAFRLLPGLPDRGYMLSRALGLLLVGYVFWMLVSLGFSRNTPGGILLAMAIIGGLSIWAYLGREDKSEGISTWLREHHRVVIVAEALFLIAFAGWTFVRAYNPDIAGTEKPMELAFLNGIRGSDTFPPRDPWLSGYAISYYYFGYVIIAMLADLSNVSSGVAFNLAIALLFALTLLGSYGLVYNLVAARRRSAMPNRMPSGEVVSSLLGPLFVGVVGNWQGLFELLHALNVRFLGEGFWRWLDIEDINMPAATRLWPPDVWRNWWWWRASRVIHDRDAAGISIGLQPIDEFPFFSFLLGDMHPHVLALPFVLMTLGMALNVALQRERLTRLQFGLYAVCFGGLAFLNTWDLPIYLFVMVGALVVRRIRLRGWFEVADLRDPLMTGFAIAVAGMMAYLPWLVSFSSQAGGILPNAIFATRLHQFLVMFGVFLPIIVWFLADRGVAAWHSADWGTGVLLGIAILAMLITLTTLLGALILRAEPAVQAFAVMSAGHPVEGQTPEVIASLVPHAVRTIILHRLTHPLTPLALLAILIVTLAVLLPKPMSNRLIMSRPTDDPALDTPTSFILVLILTGTLLTLGPEFVYLRDNFGQRLNTIFKFYYAAWIVWAIAAAYAIHVIAERRSPFIRITLVVVTSTLVLAGMIYPLLALPSKTGNFTRTDGQPPPTLDGIAYIQQLYPDDYRGISWLQQNAEAEAVVLEAVGGAYSYYGRVSSATGLPTVLGWANHERQWRGTRYDEMAGTREQDVQEIYRSPNIQRAMDLIRQYNVTYIFIGTLERNPEYASPAGLEKFDRYLTAVYRDGNVVIYHANLPRVEEVELP